MRTGLSVMLWLSFLAVVAIEGAVLLRACGLLMPLTAMLPGPGWDFCPSAPPALSAETEHGVALRKRARRLELELAQKALACAGIPKPPPPPLQLPTQAGGPRPQQTALLKPPPPPPKRDLDAERWNNKDLSMLKGCWQLGRESATTFAGPHGTETCKVTVGRICFEENGSGSREMTDICPSNGTVSCTAPITARFNDDGTLATTQPQVGCSNGITQWNDRPNWLACRRVSNTLAICRDGLNFEHEFRR